MTEVADTFGTNDVAWPFSGNEVIEFVNIESRTAIVNKSRDAIFLCLTTFSVMMVMVVLMSFMGVMMMAMGFFFLFFSNWSFYSPNPSR